MKLKILLPLVLVLLLGMANAQTAALVLPNSDIPIDWCLTWVAGPQIGQPAHVPNVGLVYRVSAYGIGSGNHTHDTSTANPRPPILIAALGDALVNDVAEAYTDSLGCAHFHIGTPKFAGYYFTDIRIDISTCTDPNYGCGSAASPFALQVFNPPYTNGNWAQSLATTSDSQHLPSTNYLAQGMPLLSLKNAYIANSLPTNVNLTIRRSSLIWGGWLDGNQVLPVSPIWADYNPDPHKYGYSFDIVSPSTAATKLAFVYAIRQYCPVPFKAGVAIYDFYRRNSPTNTEYTNNTTYTWHIYCPGSYQTVYPN